MWPFESNVLDHRTLHELNSFSIAFLQNLQHQVVQDPWDVLFCELGNLKRRLGALLTSLGKDSHLHLPPGFPLTPVHMEKDLNLGGGPISRAQGALEPKETEDKTYYLAQCAQVGGSVGTTHRDVIWYGSRISGEEILSPTFRSLLCHWHTVWPTGMFVMKTANHKPLKLEGTSGKFQAQCDHFRDEAHPGLVSRPETQQVEEPRLERQSLDPKPRPPHM